MKITVEEIKNYLKENQDEPGSDPSNFQLGWISAFDKISKWLEEKEKNVKFGCHCDLNYGETPDSCVLDSTDLNIVNSCVYAKDLFKIKGIKEDCHFWIRIGSEKSKYYTEDVFK